MLDSELLEKIKREYPEAKLKIRSSYVGNEQVDAWTLDLDGLYRTDDPEEEVPCWFNHGKGCILGEDEPFDCKTWPLRVMLKDEKLVITITFSPACKVLSTKPLSEIQNLVTSGLGRKMFEFAKRYPGFILDYKEHDHDPVLMEDE